MGEVKTMTTRKIIFDSKNIPCDIAYVEWVLKSDYDALKQLSDAFYLKQVQLENQNEDLKAKLEKAELEVKFVKEYLNPADTSFKQMIDTFRILPKEKQDKLIKLSQSLVDFENT